MTYLGRIFLKNIIFLGLITITACVLSKPLIRIFSHNIVLNIVIIFCFSMGVILNFYLLWRLKKDQAWLDLREQSA